VGAPPEHVPPVQVVAGDGVVERVPDEVHHLGQPVHVHARLVGAAVHPAVRAQAVLQKFRSVRQVGGRGAVHTPGAAVRLGESEAIGQVHHPTRWGRTTAEATICSSPRN
jgi:hypothetical protein